MASSSLVWQRVIEFLASNANTRTSSLNATIDSNPIVLGDSLNSVRERLSLRCLKMFTGMTCEKAPPAVAINTTLTLDSSEKIDASHTCEKVMCSKVEAANDYGKANDGFNGGDHQQFILLKRVALKKPYIELLKEKVLETSQPDFSYSKECNNLSEVSRPGYASQRPKMLYLIRKYRELKNLANTPLECVGGASQKDYSSLQHLAEQNAMDDMKNQHTNIDGTQNEFHMEKIKTIPGKISAEFHDVETQLPKEKLCDSASPIFAPDDLDDSRSGHESQNIAKSPLKCVGGASQEDYSFLQNLAEQNAMDDMKNQHTNVDGTQNEFQMEKTEAIHGKISSEFHDVETQLPKGKLSDYASPIFSPVDLNDSHDSQNLNVLHHDRLEVADSDCEDVNLLEQCSMPQPSSAQRLCIKCGSNDQLLNCNGEGCLRTIHERCLGLLASVEETGIFYCPFCSYKNARMMFEKAKRKAQVARRNLFSFYDISPAIHARKRESPEKNLIESDQVNAKHNMEECSKFLGREDGSTQVTGERQPVNDLGITGYESLFSDLNAFHETNDACVNNSTCEVISDHLQSDERKNLHSSDADDEQISLQPNKISALNVEGGCDHSANLKALSSKISTRFAKRKRSDKADRGDAYHGVIERKRADGIPLRVLRKRQTQLNRCSVTKRSPIRRPKLIWKPEEEEILEEAIQKITQNDDGNFPWIKILEYCRPVIHESRTPIDLKDKWRNMQRKEVRTRG